MLEKILFQKNSNFIYTRYTVNELKMEVVCIIVFWDLPNNAQSLLLALKSGITPSKAHGFSRDGTWSRHMQDVLYLLFYLFDS